MHIHLRSLSFTYLLMYYTHIFMNDKDTEILEVNLFAFVYSLFHEDFSPSIAHSTTCDCRTNLNYE